jgi:DNA-binding CsgD family transcriptional regulator
MPLRERIVEVHAVREESIAPFLRNPALEELARLVEGCQSGDLRRDVYPLLAQIVPHAAFECGTCRIGPGLGSVHGNLSAEFVTRSAWPQGQFFMRSSLLDSVTSATPVYYDNSPFAVGYAAHSVPMDDGSCHFYLALKAPTRWTAWERLLVQLLTPHLSVCYRRSRTAEQLPVGALTSRESEVLGWICRGKSNLEIASILGISGWTVKIHVSRVLNKLGASTRGHAVAKAVSHGMVCMQTHELRAAIVPAAPVHS